MLRKEVCQKCYRFNEKVWDGDAEDEWGEGRVVCPCDYFNTINYKGSKTNTGALRGMFAGIFGWHEIKDATPDYCKFSEEHDC